MKSELSCSSATGLNTFSHLVAVGLQRLVNKSNRTSVSSTSVPLSPSPPQQGVEPLIASYDKEELPSAYTPS